jgi:hypothetical protein
MDLQLPVQSAPITSVNSKFEPRDFLRKEQWNQKYFKGSSWSWSYGSWIYHYLCNQCTSPLTLWVWTPLRRGVLDTKLCDTVCQWLATGRWFSPDTPVSSTNISDRHDITEILFKVTLIAISLTLVLLKKKIFEKFRSRIEKKMCVWNKI